MAHSNSGLDLELAKHNKRTQLAAEAGILLHDFKNLIHTSQIDSESLTEKLTKVGERLESNISQLSITEDAVSAATVRCELNQTQQANRDQVTLRETNDRVITLRKMDTEVTIRAIAGSAVNLAPDTTPTAADQIKFNSKRDQIFHVLELPGVPRTCDGLSQSCEPPPYQNGGGITFEIERGNRKLAGLQHSVYEIMTSLDECSADASLVNIRDDKSFAIRELQRLRTKLHYSTVTEEAKLRSLASKAVDCRMKLRETMVAISKLSQIAEVHARTSKPD